MKAKGDDACMDLLMTEIVRLYGGSRSNAGTEGASPKPSVVAGEGLEAMGFQVGCQLAERHAKSRPRFADTLDVVKFICKDFWSEVFGKQIDNLKTNHRGVFVLHDAKFRWLRLVSVEKAGGVGAAEAGAAGNAGAGAPGANGSAGGGMQPVDMLRFPCGLVRGALSALGITAAVTAEVAAALPACSFTMKITKDAVVQ